MKKTIEICSYGNQVLDIASVVDEFKIPVSEFLISRLKITLNLDYDGCYYEGDRPEIAATIEYLGTSDKESE